MKQKIVYENGIAFLPGAKAVATSYKKTEDAATEKVVIPKDYSSWPWSIILHYIFKKIKGFTICPLFVLYAKRNGMLYGMKTQV